jgi:peptidoglycan biosynthesis protein MviN/MurJ (putative lipid II flippase)
MISGGALALLVAATEGSNASTDGFFAAFAVYAAVVSFAQSTRTTVVARLTEGETRFSELDRYLGAAAIVSAIVVVAFGPFGGMLAELLTGDLPDQAYDTARVALLILIPSAALQLFAALGAAMLGALERFMIAGGAFVVGSLVTIVAFAALRPLLDLDALPTAMLIGSVVSAAVIAAGLLSEGWRPHAAVRGAVVALRVLTVSSVSFLVAQIGTIVTLAIGASFGVGIVTLLTYASMAMGLLQALFVSAVPMVLAAPLALTWDRRPESLIPHHEAVLRAGMLMTVPFVVAAAMIGTDVVELVTAFTADEAQLMIELFLILSANVLWGQLQSVPYAALLAIGRYGAIAVLTAVVVAVQIVIAVIASSLDDVHLLAASGPISIVISAVGVCVLVSPRYLPLAAPKLGRVLALNALIAAASFGAVWGVSRLLGLPDGVAFVAGLAAYLALMLVPSAERDTARRLLRAVPLRR